MIDGSNPNLASLNLVDVNGPDVSYDGTQILFAGLVKAPVNKPYNTNPENELGAWRIYKINKDGTGLTQLTFTDIQSIVRNSTLPVLLLNDFSLYDDIDPIWLPDGRICFVSTRYREIRIMLPQGHKLFVMNGRWNKHASYHYRSKWCERPS
ncbi:MAG: PD40 domain-containing protein [Bacteroidetes bacterium]|nr:PD40 domain-containing protein [Bacteroidota bacterium]